MNVGCAACHLVIYNLSVYVLSAHWLNRALRPPSPCCIRHASLSDTVLLNHLSFNWPEEF